MTKWKKRFHKAVIFATKAHQGQVRKGPRTLPYILHPMDVADEVGRYSGLDGRDLYRAMTTAVLHDTIEDTGVTHADITKVFGRKIADGVQALSKDLSITDRRLRFLSQMDAIRKQPHWVQVCKIADRFCNLKEFPGHWDRDKIGLYLDEGYDIAERFRSASPDLSAVLVAEIHSHRNLLSIVEER